MWGCRVTIYVDNAQIPADVPNHDTGRTVTSTWSHLISDQLDPTELHEFATKTLGLRKSYFQPGRMTATGEPNPSGDHYDLTDGKRKQAIAQGAKPVNILDLGAILRRKSMAHRGAPDIQVIAKHLASDDGTFTLDHNSGRWTVGIQWGREAEDSPMVAAAAYGEGATAREAIDAAIREAGWE